MHKRRIAITLSLAACAICIAVIILLVIVIIQGSTGVNEGSLPSQYVDEGIDLFSPKVIMLILTTGVLGTSVFLLLYSLSSLREVPDSAESTAVDSDVVANEGISVPTADGESEGEETTPQKTDLALESKLPKDELEIYLLIREEGGEMLQKNIVAKRIFSQAKVTRLLDKLENRGLIVRVRHGMTNKIRLIE